MPHTTDELRAMYERVTGDGYEIDEDTARPLEVTMNELHDKHGTYVLEALVTYCEISALEPTAGQLETLMENGYRDRWATGGKFAEKWVKDHFDAEAIDEVGRYVDWQAYADGEIHDHTFVTIPGTNDVFVFEDIEL